MSRSKLLAIIICTIVALGLLFAVGAHAQRRRVVRVAPRPVVGVRTYYGPRFYDPYWYGAGWYGAGFPYAWYQPFPRPYGSWGYDYASAIRFDVKPKETEVFVDGYYTGVVDEFDGVFQRLRIEPGQHEIQLYLNGHRLVRRGVYLQPGITFRFRQVMEPLQAGDTADPRPVGTTAPPPPGQYEPGRPRGPLMGPNRGGPPPPPPQGESRGPRDSTFGAVAIRVQPGDAEILVDGERWQGPSGERLVVELPEGEHRIEVRRSGFDAFVSTVRVRRGETTTVNVSLVKDRL